MFLVVALVISLSITSAFAATPATYEFETLTDNKTVSVDMPGDYTKFASLEDENGEIDPQNYTITGDEQTTTVTLKGEYLNNLSNGEYNFRGYFENILLTYEFTASETAGVIIPASENSVFVKLTANKADVEPSNYVVNHSADGFVITVNEEFLQTLPENTTFCAYYYDNSVCYMKLQVNRQEQLQPTTNNSTNSTAADNKTGNNQQSLVSPKTGDNSSALRIILFTLASVSAVVFTFGVLSKMKNNR